MHYDGSTGSATESNFLMNIKGEKTSPDKVQTENGEQSAPSVMTTISFSVNVIPFKPGLSNFANKWYLTVLEDSAGVPGHPQFLPFEDIDVSIAMNL